MAKRKSGDAKDACRVCGGACGVRWRKIEFAGMADDYVGGCAIEDRYAHQREASDAEDGAEILSSPCLATSRDTARRHAQVALADIESARVVADVVADHRRETYRRLLESGVDCDDLMLLGMSRGRAVFTLQTGQMMRGARGRARDLHTALRLSGSAAHGGG